MSKQNTKIKNSFMKMMMLLWNLPIAYSPLIIYDWGAGENDILPKRTRFDCTKKKERKKERKKEEEKKTVLGKHLHTLRNERGGRQLPE